MGIGFVAHADMGNRFASCADMGNRFAERVSWGVRTSAFQVRSCGVRFVVGARCPRRARADRACARNGSGRLTWGRVPRGPCPKDPIFGRFRDVFSSAPCHISRPFARSSVLLGTPIQDPSILYDCSLYLVRRTSSMYTGQLPWPRDVSRRPP